MKTLLSLLTLALPALAQPLTRANVANILGFEDSQNGRLSAFWGAGTNPEITADHQVFQSGRFAAKITRAATGNFTTIGAGLPQDFGGQVLEFRGWVKRENVNGQIAIWLRQDGSAGSLAFNTIQGENLNGTADWVQKSVSIRLQAGGRQIVFGYLLSGSGTAWVDSLELLVDGKPIAEAPALPPSVLVTDREFDAGSKVNATELSDTQVTNLATLGKVWGFVKYHHPLIAQGQKHFDYELFRVMPAVLAAADADAAHAAMKAWIDSLGAVPPCTTCAALSTTALQKAPDNDWIGDANALGSALSQTLESLYRNRARGPRFYVEKAPGAGNPSFLNELPYSALRHPDTGYQLLALFRLWNMMQYFNPNRVIMGDDPNNASAYWHGVLADSIRPFALAADRLTYQQEFLKLIAKINDTHANLWSGTSALPPMGTCYLPADFRFVEGVPIVYRRITRDAAAANPFELGDIILQLGDTPVEELVAQWTPYYPASNEPTRQRDIARFLGRGACGEATVTVQRGDEVLELKPDRLAVGALDFSRTSVHDLPGAVFQKLGDDVAYLKLSAVRAADSANYIRQAAGTKGLIIDIRNYPSEFVVFTLGQLLVAERTTFVRFTEVSLDNPGAFHFTASATLVPQAPRYTGKVVILVDEISQSQAEYTTMAFRTAPGAIVLGSTTAGADGNVSLISLPGAQSSYISGLGVFYSDERPTQRIGIIPDLEVLPTIAGIRAGRDELIEEALRQIRGQ